MAVLSDSYSETSIDSDNDINDFIVYQFGNSEVELPVKKEISKKDKIN
jgi:hypothetical protein